MNTYKGRLSFYFATGEGPFPLVIVNHSHPDIWKKTYAFNKREKPFVIISNPKTKEIVYEGQWSYSRIKTAQNNYFPTPEEIDASLWMNWCQQGFEIEIRINDLIEADLSCISINYLVDLWEVTDDQKLLRAQACRIYPITVTKNFDAVKQGFRWLSDEVVQNFYFNEANKELRIFTKSHQYIITPKLEVVSDGRGLLT